MPWKIEEHGNGSNIAERSLIGQTMNYCYWIMSTKHKMVENGRKKCCGLVGLLEPPQITNLLTGKGYAEKTAKN